MNYNNLRLFVRILKRLFDLPFDPSYLRGSDIADELEHELEEFAFVEVAEDAVCALDTISINDALEVVSVAFSSISDLSEEVKGFDDAPGPSGTKAGASAPPPPGSVPFYFPRAGAPPPPPGPPGAMSGSGPRPPALPGPGRIHYPSQDPSRMGATQNQ